MSNFQLGNKHKIFKFTGSDLGQTLCTHSLVRVALISSHTAQFDTGSDLGQTCPAPSLARLPLTFTVSGSDLSWKRVSSQSDVYSKIYRLFKVE